MTVPAVNPSKLIVTRFAPSPTGYLHVGHVLAAKEAFGFAGAHGGTCLLRIEDIDITRCRPRFTDAIYEDLAWLGFTWPKPARVQSAHMSDYLTVLADLKSRGLVYPCFKTRRDIKQIISETGAPYRAGSFPGAAEIAAHEKSANAGAWRLSIRAAAEAIGDMPTYMDTGRTCKVDLTNCEDVILARRDIGTSYLLSCTYDDALQGITDVVRGKDLQELTGIQVLLQTLMGGAVPRYHHHDLVMRTQDEKLSKRSGDTSVRALKAAGYSAQQVLNMATPGINAQKI